MGLLYELQGKYEAAESLYVRCLEARTRALGADHPDTLTSVNSLAGLYISQGKYEAAESLYVRSLEDSTLILGVEHPNTMSYESNLAALYEAVGKCKAAEALRKRLEMRSRTLGAEHPADTVEQCQTTW
jgi:tetratricopeptide (TPR) repeat protein